MEWGGSRARDAYLIVNLICKWAGASRVRHAWSFGARPCTRTRTNKWNMFHKVAECMSAVCTLGYPLEPNQHVPPNQLRQNVTFRCSAKQITAHVAGPTCTAPRHTSFLLLIMSTCAPLDRLILVAYITSALHCHSDLFLTSPPPCLLSQPSFCLLKYLYILSF